MSNELLIEIVGGIVTVFGIVAGSKEFSKWLERRRAKKNETKLLKEKVHGLELLVGNIRSALEIAIEFIEDDKILIRIKKILDESENKDA